MENFKLASQEKFRYQTSRGSLTTEQLWDLSIEDLDTLAVQLDSEYTKSGKKSFIAKSSAKDKTAKAKFDIVLEVLNTKQEHIQAAQEALEIKEHNKKIIALISEKKDESLKGKTIKQLEGMLK